MSSTNFAVVCMLFYVSDVMWDTWAEKGCLVDLELWWYSVGPGTVVLVPFLINAFNCLSLLFVWISEILVHRQWISGGLGIAVLLLFEVQCCVLSLLMLAKWVPDYTPFHGALVSFYSITVAAKAWSFVHLNRKLARGVAETDLTPDTPPIPFPHNLELNRFLFFALAPTLCYSTAFKRCKKRDWGFMFKMAFECLCVFLILYITLVEHVFPIARSEPNLLRALVRMGLAGLIVWWAAFYAIFHNVLNLMAEVVGLAERKSYGDWWCVRSLAQFWREWNVRTHEWLRRDVFVFCGEVGMSRRVSLLVTFVVTGIMHEYVLLAAFRRVRVFFLLGMSLSLLLMNVWKLPFFKERRWGNLAVWICLSLATPVMVLAYSRSYWDIDKIQ